MRLQSPIATAGHIVEARNEGFESASGLGDRLLRLIVGDDLGRHAQVPRLALHLTDH